MAAVGNSSEVVSDHSNNELKAVLNAFETGLLTPAVSGELQSWVEEVQRLWEKASAQVYSHIERIHPRQFEEISKQDPELLPRVEQLQAEDAAIEQQRQQLSHSIGQVLRQVPEIEPDEEKAQKHTRGIVDGGMAFLIRVRKQEVAVQTWYIEAFNRDGGAVD